MKTVHPEEYYIKDDGVFPGSKFPVLFYKNVLKLPFLFPSAAIRGIFGKHDWTNNWRAGIFTYRHYHSNTHEAIGVVKGETVLELGGEEDVCLTIRKGDVVIIPAGVAHKNLGKENDVICVGGYPDGRAYNTKYGKAGERPEADKQIAAIPLPETDPVFGKNGPLVRIWRSSLISI